MRIKPRTNLAQISLLAVSAALLIAIATTIYLKWNWYNNNDNDGTSETHRGNSSDATSYETLGTDNGINPSISIVNNSVPNLDLFLACPDLQGELSATCLEFLDTHFLHRTINSSFYTKYILNSGTTTYDDLFLDPYSNLALVIETLEREECISGEVEMNADRGELCNVRAIERLAILLKTCESSYVDKYQTVWFKPFSDYDGKTRYDYEMDYIEKYRNSNQVEFDNLVYAIHEEVLEDRWISQQCLKIRYSDFDFPSDSDAYRNLAKSTERFKEMNFYGIRGGLERLAIELGGGWGFSDRYIVGYLLHESSLLDDSLHSYYANNHPWILHLQRALDPLSTRSSRLREGIEAVFEIEKLGWKFDIDDFVRSFCMNDPIVRVFESKAKGLDSKQSCAFAMSELNSTIPSGKVQRLRILDRFEQSALKLGVYDSH